MALIIEDGSNVTGADSFASAADLVSYAAKYGFSIPSDTSAQEALLRRAALTMQNMQWKGTKVHAQQALSWPRYNVKIDWEYLPDNYIPARIQYGQMALAAEIYADDSNPVETMKGPVSSEKVDVIAVTYGTLKVTERLLPAAAERQSRAQFADYLQTRGLFLVRA
jgi:hypothetical protein